MALPYFRTRARFLPGGLLRQGDEVSSSLTFELIWSKCLASDTIDCRVNSCEFDWICDNDLDVPTDDDENAIAKLCTFSNSMIVTTCSSIHCLIALDCLKADNDFVLRLIAVFVSVHWCCVRSDVSLFTQNVCADENRCSEGRCRRRDELPTMVENPHSSFALLMLRG